MAGKKIIYNLDNPEDVKKIHSMLFDDTSGDEDFGEQSDSDSEDQIHKREENSDTEQSCNESDGDDPGNASYYMANHKKNGKIVDSYQWNKCPCPNKRRRGKQNLLLHIPGVIGTAMNAETILDTWLILFDESILDSVVAWTNQHIELVRPQFNRLRDARSTDVIEMKAFMGLLYLAGVYRGSRLNLEDLWDPSGDGVETFRLTMSLKRFRFLMRCIRFDNKETRNERKELDRIAPIRECFETFVANCQKSYSLGENVTLDEKLEAFRGRCGFRQYIPSKTCQIWNQDLCTCRFQNVLHFQHGSICWETTRWTVCCQ
ncbi:piggyBac transposable element-derived protein 4-like [Bacillus rossius redtenbacheri]|uniref:piggyBac transposable element-derived protein 4-like n=1 Tax=Bacillus rossius redtenbacheri TaxID=93214 RepID=UPI002FDD9510